MKNTAQCSDNQPENDLISVDKNPEENAPELEKEINKLEKVTVKSEEIHTKHNTNNPKTKKTLTKPKRTNRQSFRSDDEEEDDEDGYSEEAEDDWDWDYGEQWKEGDEKKDPEKANEEEEEARQNYLTSFDKMNQIEMSYLIKLFRYPLLVFKTLAKTQF